MRRPGQPLRFLGWVVGGWIAMRAAVLLLAALPFFSVATRQGGLAAVRPRASVQPPAARSLAMIRSVVALAGMSERGLVSGRNGMVSAYSADGTKPVVAGAIGGGGIVARLAVRGSHREGEGTSSIRTIQATQKAVSQATLSSRRWSATAWMLWRPEVASGLAQAPLLGGSQMGARIDYGVVDGRLGRLGLYGRVSRALTGAPAEEAALGVAFRPDHAPVTVLAERRQRLGRGGRTGFALLAAGGLNPREVAPRLIAEGYAQAGIVGLPGLDGFADGKASLGYRLTPGRAPARLTLGTSLSGGVQPGAGRLDIGPELSLRLPTGAAALRLSVEWRERVLGDARPARGPVITLVSDF